MRDKDDDVKKNNYIAKNFTVMKHILFIIALIAVCGTAQCQETEDIRTFSLTILNKRNKPIPNNNIVVYCTNTTDGKFPSDMGVVEFDNVTGKDTVSFFYNRSIYAFPVGNLKSLVISVKGNRATVRDTNLNGKINPGYETVNIGYGIVSERNKVAPVHNVDMSQTITGGYKDLIDYLSGRVAGLEIVRNEAFIRGGQTMSFRGAVPALVIVDGIIVDNLATANAMVHINTIKSISVDKEGSMYGSRGAGGAILITTKQGGDR